MTHAPLPKPLPMGADAPPVAILMSVYAGAEVKHLDEAFRSLRAQEGVRLRVFLYCDGPLRGAQEAIIAQHIDLDAGDTVLRGEHPAGLPFGLNALIDRALRDPDIEYFARMDADDLCLPQRIARQVRFLQERPRVDIVGTWVIEFTEPGVPLFHKRLPVEEADVLNFMVCRSPLAHPSVMFRRRVLSPGHRYEPRLTQMQDYEMWSRLIRTGFVISNIPEYLLWYRMAPGFFTRRAGIRRAATEVSMRLRYAWHMHRLRPLDLLRLAGLFLVRVSPESLKRLAYLRMR
jgi:glycosyltransferase involved in cell wall biosynthesis